MLERRSFYCIVAMELFFFATMSFPTWNKKCVYQNGHSKIDEFFLGFCRMAHINEELDLSKRVHLRSIKIESKIAPDQKTTWCIFRTIIKLLKCVSTYRVCLRNIRSFFHREIRASRNILIESVLGYNTYISSVVTLKFFVQIFI